MPIHTPKPRGRSSDQPSASVSTRREWVAVKLVVEGGAALLRELLDLSSKEGIDADNQRVGLRLCHA